MNQPAVTLGEKLLRKNEVAALLACSGRTIDRLVSAGRLKRIKVLGAVRFQMSQVKSIIEGGAQ